MTGFVCEPKNPGGHGGWGALVKVDGKVAWSGSGYIPAGPLVSNNVSEYSGCLAALEWILEKAPPGVVLVRGDSKLVINQLCGAWQIKGGFYVPYYQKARDILKRVMAKYDRNVVFQWIPRAENDECDNLSKDELRKRGIKFRIQPEK